MTAPTESASWYEAHAGELASAYEAIDPEDLHGWFADLLPPAPALVLDVGAGTGRDAAWLAGKGFNVIAAEPATAMRAEAENRHAAFGITWVADQLPALTSVYRQGLSFHLILLSGVWQHVAPGERERAMRKLLGLLRAGGLLALSLRHGPPGAAASCIRSRCRRWSGSPASMAPSSSAPSHYRTGRGGRTSPGRAWCSGCPTTAPARCRCFGTSSSTTRRARPTSLACCGPYAGPRTVRQASPTVMRAYATRQGRALDEGTIGAAMTWAEPSRDVTLPRERALALLDRGEPLHCVWSGKRLGPASLDIDHCFPWSAWPCGDLWNLLPAHRQVNQHEKRDRLPGGELLQTAFEPIQAWWRRAYLDGELLRRRFGDEARASLPGLGDLEQVAATEDVFVAMHMQRLRLRHDQQVPEWTR